MTPAADQIALYRRNHRRRVLFVAALAVGRIAIVVLHDLACVAQWADRIAVLHQGRLFAFGTPQEVLTSDMLRHVYRIDARIERCSFGRLQIMTDGVAPLTQQEARK